MKDDARSMFLTLVQVEVAGALALATVLGRCFELTLGQGEGIARKLVGMTRESDGRETGRCNRLCAETAAEYRDYLRELAAAPGLAAMSFLDQLDKLRAPHPPVA